MRPGKWKPVGRAGWLFVSANLVLSAACHKSQPAWRSQNFKEEDRSTSSIQAELPRSLWTKITGVLSLQEPEQPAKGGHGEGHGGGGESHGDGHHEEKAGEASSGAPKGANPVMHPSLFAPLNVYLVEKSPGALTSGSTAIKFGSGGGTLDLHDFVKDKSGSFGFAVDFMPEVEVKDVKVYFLSNSIERNSPLKPKSGHPSEKYGAGCNKYFEITTMFNKAMKKDGLIVESTDNRDVSVLAGTYYFAAALDKKLYLASLNVIDSSTPRLLCRQEK